MTTELIREMPGAVQCGVLCAIEETEAKQRLGIFGPAVKNGGHTKGERLCLANAERRSLLGGGLRNDEET